MTDFTKASEFVAALPLLQLKPDELAHYGVLGMRWGYRKPESVERDEREERHIRNTRRKLAAGTLGASVAVPAAVKAVQKRNAEKRSRQSEDYVTSRRLKKRPTPELSNADIDKIVNRLQKEQNLRRLDPTNTDKAKKIVLGTVAATGTATSLYTFIKSPLGQKAVANGAKIVAAIIKRRA